MPKLTAVPSSIDTPNSTQVAACSGRRNGKNSAPIAIGGSRRMSTA